MAGICLDNQIFVEPPAAAASGLLSRDLGRSTAVPSQKEDVVLISSDDESDYGDLDDSQSDISFPPLDEVGRFAGDGVAESGSTASAGMCMYSPFVGSG